MATTIGRLLPSRIDEELQGERRRMAREIHDRAGDDLAYTLQCLELYDVHSRSAPDLAAGRVDAAHQTLLRACDAIRAVTDESRAAAQPVSDLAGALRRYVDRARALGVALQVTVNGDETRPASMVRDQSTLILREALRNALSHADPGRITVRVDIGQAEPRAVVIDVGRGFRPHDAARGGTGIACMRERAQLIGGDIRIESRIGIGSRVELTVSLHAEA